MLWAVSTGLVYTRIQELTNQGKQILATDQDKSSTLRVYSLPLQQEFRKIFCCPVICVSGKSQQLRVKSEKLGKQESPARKLGVLVSDELLNRQSFKCEAVHDFERVCEILQACPRNCSQTR